jgi:hypothetical protein
MEYEKSIGGHKAVLYTILREYQATLTEDISIMKV